MLHNRHWVPNMENLRLRGGTASGAGAGSQVGER
jgi:hypothetical protein